MARSAVSPVSSTNSLAVDLALLLALGDDRARAGARVETVDARAAGANALGQRALRIELELELLREILALEFLVLADVRGNHLADLPRLEQQPEPEAVDAGIVGDHREIARARVAQRDDEVLRNAAQAEAAGHHRHAIAREPGERGRGVCVNLLAGHRAASTDARAGTPDSAAQFSAISASRG